MSYILVTGAAGFIGSNLTDKLFELGHQVICLDNLSAGIKENIKNCLEFFHGDINDIVLIDRIFKKYQIEYVFHLAAFIDLRESIKDPYKCYKNNVMGSINLINACTKYKIKKFIFSSTGGAIYSSTEQVPWTEETKVSPASPYGLSKLAIEEYLELSKNLYELDYCILRYANVYGKRQSGAYSGIISILIKNSLNNKQTTIFGGNQSRDFVYIDDVISANLLAMNLNGIYNVSSNKKTSINKLIEIINKYLKCDIIYTDSIKGEILHTQLCAFKLQQKGWSNNTNIENGINETIKWLQSKL